MASGPTISPFGDAAVLVQLEDSTDVASSAATAHALASRIRAATATLAGYGAAVAGSSSVLVHIDPTDRGTDSALALVSRIVKGFDPASAAWPATAPTLEIPVRYGGVDGPDLDEVADLTGLSRSAIVEQHASSIYRVLFLGFAPGYAYLGPLPAGLVVPRRASPRVRVPSGSVAVAGPYTAVYPIESPGGWRILGRTAISMWDAQRDPPALLQPGMLVRFVPLPDA